MLPMIALVNSKSGGQDGPKLIQKLHQHLPKDNVFDLAEGGPALGLAKCRNQRVRVLVCGGDGTVAWVLSEIQKLHLEETLRPVVAILPLGTANDLSRTLKWGPGWAGENIRDVLQQIEKASVVRMDQWHVLSAPVAGDSQDRLYVMNNYFSIGSDAEVALKFHKKREEKPNLFKNRTRNKGWYAKFAVSSFMRAQPLASGIEVELDGVKLELPSKLSVLLVLNLPSYASGMNPWGDPSRRNEKNKTNFSFSTVDDGKFEVVGIKGLFHAGGLQMRMVSGKRLGQGSSISIRINRPIAAQVDGEPWLQEPATIRISHGGHAMMLANSPAELKNETSVSLARSMGVAPPTSPVYASKITTSDRTYSANTLSTIQYGPVPVSKRKKGRFYCDKCNHEFFLPYMLENHVLTCNGGSSSSSSSSSSFSPLKSSSSTPAIASPGEVDVAQLFSASSLPSISSTPSSSDLTSTDSKDGQLLFKSVSAKVLTTPTEAESIPRSASAKALPSRSNSNKALSRSDSNTALPRSDSNRSLSRSDSTKALSRGISDKKVNVTFSVHTDDNGKEEAIPRSTAKEVPVTASPSAEKAMKRSVSAKHVPPTSTGGQAIPRSTSAKHVNEATAKSSESPNAETDPVEWARWRASDANKTEAKAIAARDVSNTSVNKSNEVKEVESNDGADDKPDTPEDEEGASQHEHIVLEEESKDSGFEAVTQLVQPVASS